MWLLAYCIFFGVPHATVLLLPIIMLPFLFLIMGVTWALASLGVYLRDVSQFVGPLLSMLMFLSAIFYPANSLPEQYRSLLMLNPLSPIIEEVRDSLFWGIIPNLQLVLISWLTGLPAAWLGFAWFQKIRKGFADVI